MATINPRKQHGVYINDSELLACIAMLEAEVQHQVERREEEKSRAVNAEAERDEAMATMYHERGDKEQAEDELQLSREQTEYANDAMMAMCERAERSEAEVAALKSDVRLAAWLA